MKTKKGTIEYELLVFDLFKNKIMKYLKRALGIVILTLLFGSIFTYMVMDSTLIIVLKSFAISIGIVGLIAVGIKLILTD